ncbi:MAG: hypothetical protein EOO20_25915 [Chryseobacterium sp.]|nr:MAG: hypothetical protein EOO20_25915 [Chryseobacterium sp.]
MEIEKRFVQKYIHQMALDQLESDYRARGFHVSRNRRLGEYEVDLVAEQDNEVLVIEVKAGKLTQNRKKAIAFLGDYVKRHKNYKFLVVFANEPAEKQIIVEEI